jgi:hypothetical protein
MSLAISPAQRGEHLGVSASLPYRFAAAAAQASDRHPVVGLEETFLLV